jgi:shikimate kinase
MGTLVYLKITAATVWKRLAKDTTRPLLQGADGQQKAEALLLSRESTYQKLAQLVVIADDLSPQEIVDLILQGVNL